MSTTRLRVLGIDPGFDRMGLGVIDQRGSHLTWVFHGCKKTSTKDDFSTRLQNIRDELTLVIKKYKPDVAAVEQLFFQTNAKTAMKVGMARGVILLALADASLPLVEMTPQQLKQGMTGWGAASKKQIQEMVKRMLNLKQIPQPDDAADALGIAIVGATMYRNTRR
ncbi:MAG: crossover junction endodeoxyribonuclease RuvC [Candidatus Uhrbacteria bacterium]|nr:crossover junction endodeoxyribonuclease RuvC [Candidatus Uhrbacteria bacterium]